MIEIVVGTVVVGAVIVLVVLLRNREPWPYPAEDCTHSCPNMGACEDCDCAYP